MTWTNKDNDKFIYIFNLDILGHPDTLYADNYQGVNFIFEKTNSATTVSIDTIESMPTATINIQQRKYYIQNIDVKYTNELTKQFAFIIKNTIHKNKKTLVTNDKQLMMRIVKKIIKEKITRLEQFRKATIKQNSTLAHAYIFLYDNTMERLYEIYNTLNKKIKSL